MTASFTTPVIQTTFVSSWEGMFDCFEMGWQQPAKTNFGRRLLRLAAALWFQLRECRDR
jgi:hypothetical protein